MTVINFLLWTIVLLIAAGNLVAVTKATKTAPWLLIHIPGDVVAAIIQFVVLIVLACLFFNKVL